MTNLLVMFVVYLLINLNKKDISQLWKNYLPYF